MRAREFIVEYDRGMTLKSWEQKLTSRMASDQSAPDTIDQLMEIIESADPTRNKMYAQWIVKRYVASDFAADDLDQVNLQLTDYDAVKKSLTTGKDINQLTYAQLPDIIQAGRAQKSAPKFEIIHDTEVLYNGPDGQLAIPKTETASRALGSGTAWCTAWTDRNTMFDDYNSSGKLYTWRAKNGDKFQFFWGDDIQFMNSANRPLSPKDMHFFRSINPPTKQLFAKYEDKFLEENNKSRMIKLLAALSKSQAVWKKATERFTTNAELAYNYALTTRKKFPAGEPAIATSPRYSIEYVGLLDQPFPAGEPAIATSAEFSYYYAHKFNTPFPAGEASIAKNIVLSVEYAKLFKMRFPASEPVIATSPKYAFEYAEIFSKPFPAGEPAIASDAQMSYYYARMLDTPFPAGEPAIASNAQYSVNYAEMFNMQFPAGEPAIATSPRYSFEYAEMLDRPFPAGEAAIATNPGLAKMYDEKFGTNLSQ